MTTTLFGPDSHQNGLPGAGGFLGGSPDIVNRRQQRPRDPDGPLVKWCRNTAATLKRERQSITEEMKRNSNLATGGTPWWRGRPKWKMGTKLNYCATVPLTWTSILCDAKPSVTYSALDRSKQKRADIATAAYSQASTAGNWDQAVHDGVLISQVQKKGYLSLRPKLHGDEVKPDLRVFLGEQVFLDQNATCIDDADVRLIEYRESYGSLCARFPTVRGKLQRKYAPHKENNGSNQSVLAPPATYSFSGLSPGGNSPAVTTPAYAGSPNPPDGAAGSAGMKVQEFWTNPHKTIDVEEVQFLTSGEPATQPKMFETIDDGDSEPLRRITTEGGVIYELPESLVNAMYDAQDNGGIKIIEDQPALEALTHKVRYPLYPQGRLVVIVDEDIEADDRMNPLGYIPLIEIRANSSPDGSYYGPSSVDLIADVYEALVRVVAGVGDNINLMGNNIWRVWNGEEISNDDFTNAPGGLTRESIQSLRYSKRESAPELPNYIMLHIKFLVDQIKELSGLSDIMLGKVPPKQQVSTETATIHQQASGVRFRDAHASLSRAMRTLGEQFLEFMARFYTSPVIVQIKNDAGVMEPTPMLGAYLTDPFIVEAKAGSQQPAGPSAQLQTLLSLKAVGVPVPLDTIYQLLEQIGSIPSATREMRHIEKLMQDPKQKWKLLGFGEPPQGKGQKPRQPGSKREKKGRALGVA